MNYSYHSPISGYSGAVSGSSVYSEFRAAADSFFRSEGISFNAILKHDGHRDWLNSPSIKALHEFGAYYIGDKKRKYGGVSEFTHYIEVGDWIANRTELSDIPLDVRCFAAYGHDYIEELNDKVGLSWVSAAYIVKTCWKGEEKYKNRLERTLRLITDPKSLLGRDRLMAQVQCANNEKDVLVKYIRFADKFCTYMRDYSNLKKELLKFDNVAEVNKYASNLRARGEVVLGLDINERYKKNFALLQKLIINEINLQNNALLSKNNKVFDSIKHKVTSVANHLGKVFLIRNTNAAASYAIPKEVIGRQQKPFHPCLEHHR